MNNKKVVLIVVGIIVLIGAFYGGMVYGGNNVRAAMESRATAFAQNGGLGIRSTRGMGGGTGGFTTGKIIAKDSKSITLELMANGNDPTSQGGSKIVFLDSNTTVTKQASGAISDLAIGMEVSVTSTPNADGSVSATAVQIRPATPPVLK